MTRTQTKPRRKKMLLPPAKGGVEVRWFQVLKIWKDGDAEAVYDLIPGSEALEWLNMNRNHDGHGWNVIHDGRKYRYQVREIDLSSIRYIDRKPMTLHEAIAARAESDRKIEPSKFDDGRRFNVVIIRRSDGFERVDRHLVDDYEAKHRVKRFKGDVLFRAEAREIDLKTLKPTGSFLRAERARHRKLEVAT